MENSQHSGGIVSEKEPSTSIESGEDKNTEGEKLTIESRDSIFKWLSRQKEVITLIIFFSGGLIWLYSAFVTVKQLNIGKCLLTSELKHKAASLKRDTYQDILSRINEEVNVIMLHQAGLIQSNSNLDDLDQGRLNILTKYIKALENDIKKSETEIDEIILEIRNCGEK